MGYEQRANTGGLFINEKKEKDTHPDRNGNATITCPHCNRDQKFWLSGWIKKKHNGDPWLSLSFKPAEPPKPAFDPTKHPNAPLDPPPAPSTGTFSEDDPPF